MRNSKANDLLRLTDRKPVLKQAVYAQHTRIQREKTILGTDIAKSKSVALRAAMPLARYHPV